MRSRFILHVTLLILATIGLTQLAPTKGYYTDGEFTTGTPKPDNAPSLDSVPLYPNVTYVKRGKEFRDSLPGISYSVNANYQDVATFYETNLEKSRWQPGIDKIRKDGIDFIGTWMDEPEIFPFHSQLDIKIESSSVAAGNPTTRVNFTVERTPDYRRIPTYPDAQNIITKNADIENGQINSGESVSRFVTFTTRASSSEIEHYYIRVLMEYGYGLQAERTQGGPRGLLFGYWPSHSIAAQRSSVSIITRKSQDGFTIVEIRAN